jgi:hypothetical protein
VVNRGAIGPTGREHGEMETASRKFSLFPKELSKALWAIKKRRCNVLFLREPTCRYGHPVEREKVIEKILKNPYRDLENLTRKVISPKPTSSAKKNI